MEIEPDRIWVWIAIAIAVTALVMIAIGYFYVQNMEEAFINQFAEGFMQYCLSHPQIEYRSAVSVPVVNGQYQQQLAIALVDIAFATSTANCVSVLPIPSPPNLPQQLRVEGIDPITQEPLMFAYIFWNPSLGWATIAFTGTAFVSEWQSDLQYEQVAPTQLNGYQPGVMVHSGFYNIYLAVRAALWQWRQDNPWVTTLFITGHSLGGALSTLCSYDMANSGPEIVHYSFAAPRSGNNAYANTFNQLVPTSIRVNNTEDIVPQLPPATWRHYNYCQTIGNAPFTISLSDLAANHTIAYQQYLPVCPQDVPCQS